MTEGTKIDQLSGFLIDAEKEAITPIKVEARLRNIAALLGCALVDMARFTRQGDTVFVDDNGLVHEPKHLFGINGYRHPLATRGLVLRLTRDGDLCASKLDLPTLTRNVTFFHQADEQGAAYWAIEPGQPRRFHMTHELPATIAPELVTDHLVEGGAQ